MVKTPTKIDILMGKILQKLRIDFHNKGLTVRDLEEGYEGLLLEKIRSSYAGSLAVDFDIALKDLEEAELVDTGPKEPHKNTPGSGIFFAGYFSKREYLCLTEKGYKVAQGSTISKKRESSTAQRVNISGNNFYQSPVGIGADVNQKMTVNIENDTEAIEYLIKLLESEGKKKVSPEERKEIGTLVSLTKEGDIKTAKPIFQQIFGFAADGVKQIAWGVLTAILAKNMGL